MIKEINVVKKLLKNYTILLLVFAPSAVVAEGICFHDGKKLLNCAKGDILLLSRGQQNTELVMKYCDYDRQIVAMGGSVTCKYVGKERKVKYKLQ